jgi:hypothetical protein
MGAIYLYLLNPEQSNDTTKFCMNFNNSLLKSREFPDHSQTSSSQRHYTQTNDPLTRRHILQEPSTSSCQRVGGSVFVSLLWELQHCRLYWDTVSLCTACIAFRKVLTVNCFIGPHSTKQPVSKDTRKASCDVETVFFNNITYKCFTF